MLARSGPRCGPARIAPFSLAWNVPRPEVPGHWPCTRGRPSVCRRCNRLPCEAVTAGSKRVGSGARRAPATPGASPLKTQIHRIQMFEHQSVSRVARHRSIPAAPCLPVKPGCGREARAAGSAVCPPPEQGPLQCKFLNRHARNASLTANASAHNASPTDWACASPLRDALRPGVTRAGGAGKPEDFFFFFFFQLIIHLFMGAPTATAFGIR